ncbi:MAG: hypothetical protein D6682_05205 [Zetaproteobacteria bacterium]|nr:MAG: hypothetical protein D6682_05205 [Zetaproteobacteria bacterium]
MEREVLPATPVAAPLPVAGRDTARRRDRRDRREDGGRSPREEAPSVVEQKGEGRKEPTRRDADGHIDCYG